jgi:sulfite reductase (NADPH) flavoprotein alpha-component
LQAGGLPVKVQPLAASAEDLRQSKMRCSWSAPSATAKPGQRPGSSARCWAERVPQGLNYSGAGLGDRQYEHFCGLPAPAFWLTNQGGNPLFAPVEVDSGDTAALLHWQQQLGN